MKGIYLWTANAIIIGCIELTNPVRSSYYIFALRIQRPQSALNCHTLGKPAVRSSPCELRDFRNLRPHWTSRSFESKLLVLRPTSSEISETSERTKLPGPLKTSCWIFALRAQRPQGALNLPNRLRTRCWILALRTQRLEIRLLRSRWG